MKNNVIVMKLVTAANVELSLGPNFPLYERTHENLRLDQQGPTTHRKVNIRLEGFLEGNDHQELQIQYGILKAILDRGEVKFTYSVSTPEGAGEQKLHDSQVMYVDSYSEPMDWKQYDGAYSIILYYFVPVTDSALLGVSATLCGFVFPTIPAWDRSTKPVSEDINDFLKPTGSTSNGTEVTINLKGILTADAGVANPAENLMAKMAVLEAALEANNRYGLLQYITFAVNGRVTGFSIQEVIPRTQAVFNITFKYMTTAVFNLRASKSFSRVHWNALIKEKPGCGQRSISFMNRSGQTVSWNLSCSADTIDMARQQLETEAVARIPAGGIEVEGGDEKQDENTRTVSVTITRFYNSPILPNIAGEGYVTG